MNQEDIVTRLGRNIELNGKALSEVLTTEELRLISFVTACENNGLDPDVTLAKHNGDVDMAMAAEFGL